MPQTLSDIQHLLAQRGLKPKHRLGQNFLHDARKMHAVLQAAQIQPKDHILEVGPGTGALTQHLLEAGARVIAIEIDHDLAPILQQQMAPFADSFTLIVDDVLQGKHTINPKVFQALKTACANDQIPAFKLIANLPYNIASPLLVNLALDYPAMTTAVIMVQKEVADRLAAEPDNKDYGPMGILVQAMYDAEKIAVLPPGCFWPMPKVTSAVVKLTRKPQPLTADPHRLAKFVHQLFSKRRKQLGSILGRNTPLPPDIHPSQRPETLSIAQLVALAEQLLPPTNSQ